MKRRGEVGLGKSASAKLLWVAAGLLVMAVAGSGSARPPPSSPASGACSESCDRKASECLDACSAKFKDDKPRVECKVQCAADRQKCDAACAP
jgi:hypothetical protein